MHHEASGFRSLLCRRGDGDGRTAADIPSFTPDISPGLDRIQ